MSSFGKALSRLSLSDKHGSKMGLRRIRKLCALLGNPQSRFKPILIGGTNGKGSTCAMLSSILKRAGCKTASYFSPHVFDFRERMQINGKMIPKKDCADVLTEVFDAIGANPSSFKSNPPTFFEIATAAAFYYFAKNKADYAVLEVGMGGRLDATNICDAQICAITSIGIDHAQHLGNTEKKIAYEKAGIAKKGKYAVCAKKISGIATAEIRRQCRMAGAKFATPSKSDSSLACSARLHLRGHFQKENAATAICVARLMGIPRKAILQGLQSAFIPCRLQTISRNPLLIFDSAHNPQGAASLAESLPPLLSFAHPRILLFSSMKDKDFSASLQALMPLFDAAIVFSSQLKRAASAKSIAAAAKKAGFKRIICAKSPKSAFSLAKKLAGKTGAVVACGSIYSFQYLIGRLQLRVSQ